MMMLDVANFSNSNSVHDSSRRSNPDLRFQGVLLSGTEAQCDLSIEGGSPSADPQLDIMSPGVW